MTKTPQFENMGASPIAQRVQEALRRAILNGSLRPGMQLIETELAEQMQISRAPLREAFQRLEESGLIERIPYRGAFVTGLTERAILELYGLRTVLELYALRLMIAQPHGDQIEQLESIMNEMRLAAATGNTAEVNAIDIRFHRTLIQLANHRLLEQTWHAQESNIWRTLSLRNLMNEDMRIIAENHRPIVDAIAAGDLQRAEQALRVHIEVSGEEIVRDWHRVVESHAAEAAGEPNPHAK